MNARYFSRFDDSELLGSGNVDNGIVCIFAEGLEEPTDLLFIPWCVGHSIVLVRQTLQEYSYHQILKSLMEATHCYMSLIYHWAHAV